MINNKSKHGPAKSETIIRVQDGTSRLTTPLPLVNLLGQGQDNMQFHLDLTCRFSFFGTGKEYKRSHMYVNKEQTPPNAPRKPSTRYYTANNIQTIEKQAGFSP